jgi:hypothetical protein
MKGLSKMGVVLVQEENAVGAHCPLLLTIHVLSLPGGSNNVGVRTYVQHLIHTLQCAVDISMGGISLPITLISNPYAVSEAASGRLMRKRENSRRSISFFYAN